MSKTQPLSEQARARATDLRKVFDGEPDAGLRGEIMQAASLYERAAATLSLAEHLDSVLGEKA